MPGLTVALLLPWLAGVAGARLMIPQGLPGSLTTTIGWGFFLGSFMATLIIRGASLVGAPLHFTGMAVALGLLGLLCLLPGRRRGNVPFAAAAQSEHLSVPAKALIAALLALLAWRYMTLLGILVEQPLFGWDAMMNWAPKAIVWFHSGQLTDFVDPSTWLRESTAAGPYTLGNRDASTYPEMVPLVYLWHMLGAGTWDHTLLQLPWPLAALNLALAFYGLLRLRGVPVLYATVAVYGLMSLPYVNVHTVIAGYADLWLAAVFSIGAIALDQWERHRGSNMALLAILAAVMCTQLKNPGIILGLILVFGMIRSKLALRLRTEMLIFIPTISTIALGFLTQFKFELPGVGVINLAVNEFQIGMFGPYALAFHAEATRPVLRSLFDMANWHLLWFLAVLAVFLLTARFVGPRKLSTLALVLIVMVIFYVLVFFFTYYFVNAVSYVTLNRAVLYTVPAFVFFIASHLSISRSRVAAAARS